MWSIVSYWLFAELNHHAMSTTSLLARRVTKQCRDRAARTGDSTVPVMQTMRSHPAGMTEQIQANLRMYNCIRMHLVQGVAHWIPNKFTPLYVAPGAVPSRNERFTPVTRTDIKPRLRRAS